MQKSQLLFIISLIFAIIVTVFALTNAEPVAVHLFFYTVEASQALVIFTSAASGAIIVITLGVVRYIKMVSELKNLRKENEMLKNEIPIAESTDRETDNKEIVDTQVSENSDVADK